MKKSSLEITTNERPIQHICQYGTEFNAERADLSTGVVVTDSLDQKPLQLASDFAEFGAWHAMEIRPILNGFAGYDAIGYILGGKS